MGTPACGFSGRFAMDDSTFDANSFGMDIQSEDITCENEIVFANGLRGSVSEYGGDAVQGLIGPVRGPFSLYPTPTTWDRLLPWLLGANEAATDIFALAETLQPRHFMIDRVSKVFEYDNCYCNSFTVRSATGQLQMLSVDLLGKTETMTDAGTFPSAITIPAEDPYIHHDSDGQVTIFGGTREIMESTITVDNQCFVKFNGSQTPQHIRNGGRRVEWNVLLPFTTSEIDLLAGDINGAVGSIKYVQGTKSNLWTFGKLHIPKQRPSGIRRQGEIVYPLRMVAKWDGTTRELVVTNDIT